MQAEAPAATVRLFGGAMVVGPLLLLASAVAFVAGEGLNADEPGGALLVYAAIAMTLVAIGIARALEPALPRASGVLLVLAVAGSAGAVGFGIDSIHAAVPGGTGLEDADSAAGGVALFLPGSLFPVGFAALGFALWRARVEPAPSGPLLVIAAVLFPLANIPDVESLAIVANAMFVVALAPLGIAWLRRGQVSRRSGADGDSRAAPAVGTPGTL